MPYTLNKIYYSKNRGIGKYLRIVLIFLQFLI